MNYGKPEDLLVMRLVKDKPWQRAFAMRLFIEDKYVSSFAPPWGVEGAFFSPYSITYEGWYVFNDH